MGADADVAVDVRGAVKRYGPVTALEQISLGIRDNEFFTLLGPSGCGKTTLLRMIAGFEEVTAGEIYLFGREIETLPPHQRPVNTVFQNYALFPHMSVLENVAFGLEMRGASRSEAAEKAGAMLERVQLSQFAARKPAQLSGGQQQRVALARALAPEPKVLLLDEPLSALDLKLRKAMQIELKQIQRDTGITFIFVTHDQEEALTMSDRIAVMSEGRLQQLGDARDIYEAPSNVFVADFIGETNLLEAEVIGLAEDKAICRFAGDRQMQCGLSHSAAKGARVHVSIRPERIALQAGPAPEAWPGTVQQTIFVGTDTQSIVDIGGGQTLTVRTQNSGLGRAGIFAPGAQVFATVEPGAARVLEG